MRRFGVSLVLLTAILGVPAPASAAGSATTRASVASDGTQANSGGDVPAVSGDGRYVAFESFADNLVPSDTNGLLDVFVHDRDTGGMERVSVATDGTQADGSSFQAAISGDGRYVAFQSFAKNLVPGDTNFRTDVFVRDRVTGSTERVSVASDGTQANDSSEDPPTVSADGRYVAFRSFATNLVPGDTNGQPDVFVRDRVTGSTERVSVATDGTQGNGFSSGAPTVSADGRYVAFGSLASNLVPGDTNTDPDVFVRDRVTGSTERVSVASGGTQANGISGRSAISGDGRHVAFESFADNLVPGDTNGRRDVFVYDRVTGSTERVSVAGGGSQADASSGATAISGDGRYVAFQSPASNLVPGDTNFESDVFVRDRVTGSTDRVSVASDGTQAFGFSGSAAISGDGRYVAFMSLASNLVPGDTNGSGDVFVRDRQGAAPSDTTPPTLTVPDPITAEATGQAGATVTYTATATDDTDPNPTVACAPATAATFPIGATTVDCTATDATGNQSTGSFTVTVVGAAGQLEDLKALIIAYPLKATVEASLLNKVTGVQNAVAAGKTGAACSKLAAFLGQVAEFRTARKLTAAQATELTADGTRIRAVLGC